MRLSVFLLVLAVVWFLLAGSATHAAGPLPAPAVLAILTGHDSHIADYSILRIRSDDEWKATWNRHCGASGDLFSLSGGPELRVDFKRCEVIAIFNGAHSTPSTYEGELYYQQGGIMALRIFHKSPGVAVGLEGEADFAAQYRPYAFFILPRSQRTISLQLNVQSYKNEPPKWEEVARLHALKKIEP